MRFIVLCTFMALTSFGTAQLSPPADSVRLEEIRERLQAEDGEGEGEVYDALLSEVRRSLYQWDEATSQAATSILLSELLAYWESRGVSQEHDPRAFSLAVNFQMLGMDPDRVMEEALEEVKRLSYPAFHLLIAIYYDNPEGIEQFDPRILAMVEQLAGEGSNRARYELGRFFYYGWGVPVDRERAVELFKSTTIELGMAFIYHDYFTRGKAAEAEELISDMDATSRARFLAAVGIVAYEVGSVEEAQAFWEEALALDYDCYEAAFELSKLYLVGRGSIEPDLERSGELARHLFESRQLERYPEIPFILALILHSQEQLFEQESTTRSLLGSGHLLGHMESWQMLNWFENKLLDESPPDLASLPMPPPGTESDTELYLAVYQDGRLFSPHEGRIHLEAKPFYLLFSYPEGYDGVSLQALVDEEGSLYRKALSGEATLEDLESGRSAYPENNKPNTDLFCEGDGFHYWDYTGEGDTFSSQFHLVIRKDGRVIGARKVIYILNPEEFRTYRFSVGMMQMETLLIAAIASRSSDASVVPAEASPVSSLQLFFDLTD